MDDRFAQDERLYRGLHKIWIVDDNRISSAAFKDSGGNSVDRDGGREEHTCIDRLIGASPQFAAIGRITCGEVEECGAITKYCPVEGNVYHSEIRDSEERVRIKSNSKSKNLARKCQIVYKSV